MRRQRLAVRLVQAGAFSKLLRYLQGDSLHKLPKGTGVAILTSQNPYGITQTGNYGKLDTTKQQNKNLYSQLLREISGKQYAFWQMAGDYGAFENSIAVLGLTPEQALDIGLRYDQDSVIWSGVVNGKLVHKMLYSHRLNPSKGTSPVNDGYVEDSQVWINKVQQAKEYYSEIEGRKFRIPFQDKPLEPLPDKIKEKINLTDK